MPAPSSPHYRFEEVAPGVHAALATLEGFAVCNSGLVDLGEGSLVFDAGMTPISAVDLRTHATQILGRAPTMAVTSHRHLDHFLGNSEFASVPIWSTRRTREILLETTNQIQADLSREALEKDLAMLERRRDDMKTEDLRMDLEFNLQIQRALIASAGQVKITPPDHTFDTKLRLPGARAAELVSLGSGHTEADAFLFLPHEKILIAGDLVVLGVQPSMGSGDPEHWVEELNELERLGAEKVVPGHGAVTTNEGIRYTREYLAAVLDVARTPPGTRLPAALRRWEGSVSLEWNIATTRDWVSHHPRH